MTTPNRPATYQQALAEAAKIHAARDAAPDPVAVTAHMSEQTAQAREHAAGWAKQAIQALWLAVNPYDPAQVREFTAKAAGLMVSAQTATARAAAAAQSEQLAALGIPVSAAPSNPIDVRAPAAHIAGGKVRLRHGASTVDYDGAEGSAKVSAADMSTEKVFERPAALFRYLISIGEPNADDQALLRISGLVDDNLMLAQRLAQQEVLAKAVHLDHRGGGRGRRRPKIIGFRRVIHPELSRGGTCGMCIAASDRLYKVGELMPIHRRCHCTISAVTEEHDPADDLNAVDLNALYKAAGGTSAAHLKRTRYKVDQHGELGPVIVPERKYKPRSETARKQSGGTAVSAPESKAQIAERLLPGLEKNLQDLRAKGLAEDSPQFTYHKDTIERLRGDLKSSGSEDKPAAPKKTAKPNKKEPAPTTGGDGGGRRPPGGTGKGPTDSGGNPEDRPDLTPQQHAEARVAAQAKRALAERAAPDVTPAVQAATTDQGGELQRLDSRLKDEGSLNRKIQDLMADGYPPDLAAVRIKDALRYTAVVPEQDYWAHGTAIGDALEAAGFTRNKQVRGWNREGYRGRNDTFVTPGGLEFEVQIHTAASLNAAETTHRIYEEQRLATTPEARKVELEAEQQAIFAAVPVPNDVPWLD